MAKKKLIKTNAARLLDNLHIEYELLEYPVDEDDLSAIHVAQSVNMPIGQVFKTLVVRADSEIIMAVIPGAAETDLKKLAAAARHKRCELVALKEVFALTGYVRGGCSPLGAKKKYPVYIDAAAMRQEKIAVSAGKRGAQLFLAPADLVRAAEAVVAPIARSAAEEQGADKPRS